MILFVFFGFNTKQFLTYTELTVKFIDQREPTLVLNMRIFLFSEGRKKGTVFQVESKNFILPRITYSAYLSFLM